MLTATGRQSIARSTTIDWLYARRPRREVLAALAVLSLTLGLWSPAAAQRIYDTARISPFANTECTGQKPGTCVTVRSRRTTVPVDAEKFVIELSCPPTHRFVVGWDARHHEHIALSLFFVGRLPANGDRASPREQAIQVFAHNQADRPGNAWVAVGCSKSRFRGEHPFMQTRSSVPTNRLRRR